MSVLNRKPKIFIVSSYESKPLSDVMRSYLKAQGDVTPWYLPEIWKPGSFILQVLLEQAPKYDFAVIIFGPDDKTISRGKETYAPRDNVIFEAGLFMAHLGQTRTFILTPKDQDLKILSDLAGLVLLSYDQPNSTSGLQGALKPVSNAICKEIKRQKIRQPQVAVRPGPNSFGDAHSRINELLDASRESKDQITVLNIGLDMEFTWGLILRDHVMKHTWPGRLVWKSLMIDFASESMRSVTGDVISLATAKRREEEIKTYCKAHDAELRKRKIDFECRAYSSPPVMHGFSVGTELYMGFCWNELGELACAPYLLFSTSPSDITLDGVIATQYAQVFKGAFAQQWKGAAGMAQIALVAAHITGE